MTPLTNMFEITTQDTELNNQVITKIAALAEIKAKIDKNPVDPTVGSHLEHNVIIKEEREPTAREEWGDLVSGLKTDMAGLDERLVGIDMPEV